MGRVLFVDGAELEAERLGIVFRTRYPHNDRGGLAVQGLGGDDSVLVELILEQGPDPGDDADTHVVARRGEGEGEKRWHRETSTKSTENRKKAGRLWPGGG